MPSWAPALRTELSGYCDHELTLRSPKRRRRKIADTDKADPILKGFGDHIAIAGEPASGSVVANGLALSTANTNNCTTSAASMPVQAAAACIDRAARPFTTRTHAPAVHPIAELSFLDMAKLSSASVDAPHKAGSATIHTTFADHTAQRTTTSK